VGLPTLWASLAVLCLMAAAHCLNSVFDWWLGFDRGPIRSRAKPYTSGSQVIPLGLATPGQVLTGALAWTALGMVSLLPLLPLPGLLAFYPLFPWVLSGWYSLAKKSWHPEVPLTVGFGPVACLLGAGAVGEGLTWQVFLVGLLMGAPLGVVGESIDQLLDAPHNPGLRDIGKLIYWRHIPPVLYIGAWLAVLLAYHLVLAWGGLVPWATLWAWAISSPLLALVLWRLARDLERALIPGLVWLWVFSAVVVMGMR